MQVLKFEDFANDLPKRPRDFHKGDAGHVLIIGGDFGFSGAPMLAGIAALRVGAGLVSIATRPEHAILLNLKYPELMCHGIQDTKNLDNLLNRATVIVLGPGLGRSAWSRKIFSYVTKIQKPIVVDADGLNLLSETPFHKDEWILTPHPGEASRLAHQTLNAVQEDRIETIKKINSIYGGVSVLKGAGTLICDQEEITKCEAGNPGMATAGTGDILSGMISGLIAQGLTLPKAAKLGVLLHARAGDLAAKEGERGMIATDLLLPLRSLVN